MFKIAILIFLFLYYYRLGSLYPSRGINQLLVFFVFYYLIKYSFVFVQDYIVALWIDAALIGFCTPLLLSAFYKRQITNQILLFKISILVLYGILMLITAIYFNELSTIKAFDRLRDYMLLIILTYIDKISFIQLN